jgi:hypothetical protein
VASAGRRRLTPTATDLKAMLSGQLHHVVVVAAGDQLLPQGWQPFAEGYEGLQLSHFVDEPFEILGSHGRPCGV